jgi:hypothetical protein
VNANEFRSQKYNESKLYNNHNPNHDNNSNYKIMIKYLEVRIDTRKIEIEKYSKEIALAHRKVEDIKNEIVRGNEISYTSVFYISKIVLLVIIFILVLVKVYKFLIG